MSTTRSHRLRPLVILCALAVLLVGAAPAAAAPPEVVKGQHGHYLFNDFENAPLVNCRYSGTNPAKLDKFVVKRPLAWWSDLGPGTQSGMVGWQIRIQAAATPSGPWTTVYTTTTVKKTAKEDSPLYDPADAAAFTTRGIPWSQSGTKVYRVASKVFWYFPGGTGRVTHWMSWYKQTGTLGGPVADYCLNRLSPL